jgi:hypothetical protein
MSGPLRQRRARQLESYLSRGVRVLDNRGDLVTEGKMTYLASRFTEGTTRNSGFYVGEVHIPLKSIITRGGIKTNGIFRVDRNYLDKSKSKGVNAA